MISPLFTTIVLVAGFIWIYMKVTTKKYNSEEEELLAKEAKARGVRRQPLNTLNYIDFSEDKLPTYNCEINTRIYELTNSLKNLYGKKIVNLTGISNTDLKLAYGPANLPELTEFDTNFATLTRTLYDLAVELNAEGERATAEAILSYAISIGTDISGNFITLANMYVEDGQFGKINDLILRAESIHSLTKDATIAKLQEISDTHTTMVIPAPTENNPRVMEESEKPEKPTTQDVPVVSDNILPKDIMEVLENIE